MPRNRVDVLIGIAEVMPRGAVNAFECIFCFKPRELDFRGDVPLCNPCQKKFYLLIELQSI